MRHPRLTSFLLLAGVSAATFAQTAATGTQDPVNNGNNQNNGGWRRAEDPAPQAQNQLPPPMEPMQQQPPQATAPYNRVPGQITIPAGTWVNIRVDQLLSSQYNRAGDTFSATLQAPIVADGVVVARRGQTITGRVTEAVKAGRVKGTSRLGVEVAELSLVDGQQIPVRTQLVEFNGGTSRGSDAAIIGGTTGVGAAIGAAAGGGFGAGMGAIAGAGASAIGVLLSRGRHTEVYPESMMRFRLMEPITVDTSRSEQAFHSVQQNDYENRPAQPRLQVRQPSYLGGLYGGGMYGGGWGPGWGWGGWGPAYGWGYGPRVSIFAGRGWYGGGRGWYGGRGRWR